MASRNPHPGNQRKRKRGTEPVVTFRQSPEETAELNRVAEALGVSRSRLIRDALAAYVATHPQTSTKEAARVAA